MSGRQQKRYRVARSRAEEARRAAIRDDLKRHASDHAGSILPAVLRGFSLKALGIRWQQLTLKEFVRFLLGRCVYCGYPFEKRSFGHDCHTEVCLHAMLDRLMRRRGRDFPGAP